MGRRILFSVPKRRWRLYMGNIFNCISIAFYIYKNISEHIFILVSEYDHYTSNNLRMPSVGSHNTCDMLLREEMPSLRWLWPLYSVSKKKIIVCIASLFLENFSILNDFLLNVYLSNLVICNKSVQCYNKLKRLSKKNT